MNVEATAPAIIGSGPASYRIQCCVPFCKCTRGPRKGELIVPFKEWLCGKHWMLVPADYRRVHGRSQRRARNRPTLQAIRMSTIIWDRCKRYAIERAAGI